MLRMVNLLMALSLGVHREQLEHRMGLTWPRPFLLRPLFFLCSEELGQHHARRLVEEGGDMRTFLGMLGDLADEYREGWSLKGEKEGSLSNFRCALLKCCRLVAAAAARVIGRPTLLKLQA